MKKEKISDAVIRRLPRYYRYLDELHTKGIVRISSGSLGKRMGITASQIRQDLSCFGEFGQQGYGYNIMELRAEIGHILGVDDKRRLIVIGAGHLGHALLQNFDFDQGGFLFDTAFDVSPAVIGTTVNGVTIRGMDELDAYWHRQSPLRRGADGAQMRRTGGRRPSHRPRCTGHLELHQRRAQRRRFL